jgi:Putative Flp pilus-assembly TadE/G-like
MAATTRGRADGQILVLFTLVVVAMVAMAGLVMDVGSTYSQRRGQQNAADLAALAGAVALINGQDAAVAVQRVTKTNGYEDGKNDVAVTVSVDSSAGTVTVGIAAQHQNYFSGIVGQGKWQVGVTATAEEGVPEGGIIGAAPIIFSDKAFDDTTGQPYLPYGCMSGPCTPYGFGDGNGDIPKNAGDIAWSVFGPNVDTGNCGSPGDNRVKCYLSGMSVLTTPTFALNDYVGQMNGGYHNALFGGGTGVADPTACDGKSASTNVDTCLSGKDVVVPIVSPQGTTCNNGHDGGCFEGWALFHVVSAEGASSKTLQGYFVDGFARGLGGGLCHQGKSCDGYHGLYTVRLIN